ncbi:MAG: membrane protein insertase YidC [Parachlamydiales bacterium]|nr:membrane protein insertase YidC [Parachlamydiales bacterium]
MDKRSIFFIILLALSFYFMQSWFAESEKKKSQNRITQFQHEQKTLQQDLSNKITELKDLPLVPIYSDKEKKQVLTYAVETEGQYITLAWDSHLPEQLYTKDGMVQLAFKNIRKNEPVLYSNWSHPIITTDLPSGSSFDLQLVTLDQEKPQIFLGQYQDGFIRFPLQSPQSNALALFYWQGKYHLLFFYDASTQKLVPLQTFSNFSHLIEKKGVSPSISDQSIEEKFYVLENDYLQLVFSNYGGALSEINLPFQAKFNNKSIIHPIEFDKKIEKDNPKNALFPLQSYYTYDTSILHDKGTSGKYYPLIRRSIIAQNGTYKTRLLPELYALAIIDHNETIKFRVTRFEKSFIEFEATTSQRKIKKTFSFSTKAPYIIEASISIEGNPQGLYLTSGLPEVELVSGNSLPSLKYKISKNGKNTVEKITLPKPKSIVTSLSPNWISNANGFFGLIIDPLSQMGLGYESRKILGTTAPSRLTLIDPEYNLYPADKFPAYELLLPFPARSGTYNFRVYTGPFQKSLLTIADDIYSDPVTGYNPDYLGAISFHGWFSFISEPFAKFLFLLMSFFFKLTHSWGFSIILLTFVLRLMLYPLNTWSIRSTAKMQELGPKVKALQAKYKKDPKKGQIETMKLYREAGVNPLTGCFPILIQMPFLIGMFDLLKSTFELRGVGFIPGWIDNLTAPDVLFSWNYPILFLGTEFHLLPLLLGGVMFLQQKISSKLPKNKKEWTDQQKQQKMMNNIMAIVFTLLFYNFPSGLNLYWISSMLMGMIQQWYTTKKMNLQTK